MGRQIQIPIQWQRFTGGEKHLNFSSDSQNEIAIQLVKLGIPFAAARNPDIFGGGTIPNNRSMTGDDFVRKQVAANKRTDIAQGKPIGTTGSIPNIGAGDSSDQTDAENQIISIPDEARPFSPGTFVDPSKLSDGGAEEGFGGASNAGGLFRPQDKNIVKGQGDSVVQKGAFIPGQPAVGGIGAGGRSLKPTPDLPDGSNIASGGSTNFGDSLGVDEIIGMFVEGGKFGGPTIKGADGVESLNPLLASLLDQADLQNGRLSDANIQESVNATHVQVAKFQKDEAIAVAQREGITGKALASINTKSDERIAAAQVLADQAIATTNAEAQKNIAGTQGVTDVSVATIGAGGQLGAAEAAAGGQTDAAKAAAGAASPFGFMQQATTNDALQTPEQQLKAIYDQLNAVGLAQAGAANIGAQDNAFSFAAGAGQGRNPVTGELDFDPNQIGQIAANTPAAFAAQGQENAARAGATGFGALLSGDTGVNQQANEILRAQAANNPYAMQQLGQGWASTGAADQNTRIDQILRGGLSPEQRIAEINAGQSGQNFANQLNFMSNPSAVGFATEKGLFGGQNNQVLQDINNSPEGNVPGSLFGFNSPSPAGAGGGATQNNSGGTTQNTSGAGGNFNANTLRNASDEQIGFLQGAASVGGQTPSEFNQQVESFTPQGY